MTSRIAFTSLAAALALSALRLRAARAPTLRAQSAAPGLAQGRRGRAPAPPMRRCAPRRPRPGARRWRPPTPASCPGVLAIKFAESLDPATWPALAADHGAHRSHTSGVCRLPSRDGRTRRGHRGRGARAGGGAGCRVRRAGRPDAGALPAQRSRSTSSSGTCSSSSSSAPGTSITARAVRSSSPSSTAASPIRPQAAPYAQAPDLAGTTFVAGYDFIWDDDTPARLRRPRHARHRHDRAVDQQQPRRGRHRVQRRASCPSRRSAASGTSCWDRPTSATLPSSRKRFGLRPNTARRSST